MSKLKARVHIVRHWRLIWLPGLSVSIGRIDGHKAIWVETAKNVFYLSSD